MTVHLNIPHGSQYLRTLWCYTNAVIIIIIIKTYPNKLYWLKV